MLRFIKQTTICFAFVWAAIFQFALITQAHDSRYSAYVTEVYDGDSVTIDRQLKGIPKDRLSGLWEHNVKTRLTRINAPEIRGGTNESKAAAKISQSFLASLVKGKVVEIVTNNDREDHYGRLLIEIWVDDINVNDRMVEAGHAVYETYKRSISPATMTSKWWED